MMLRFGCVRDQYSLKLPHKNNSVLEKKSGADSCIDEVRALRWRFEARM
jgi:hypothetical protein